MTIYFITRNPGANDWAEQIGLAVDEVTDRLDAGRILVGDTVIGALPVHQAADVCARGGVYLHLSLDQTADNNSQEGLTAEQIRIGHARIDQYLVRRIEPAELG